MFKRMRAAVQAFFSPVEKRQIYNPEATMLWRAGPRMLMDMGGLTNPFEQHPWVYAAITRISTNVQGVPLLIKTGKKDNAKIVESGEWYELFERINDEMDPGLFMEAVVVHLSQPGGEVFIVGTGKGENLGPKEIPFRMWPMSGDLFTPKFNGMKLAYWDMRVPGKGETQKIAPHQVVRIRGYSASNPFRGMGPLRPGKLTVDTDHDMIQYQNALMKNNADNGGVIQAPEGVNDMDFGEEDDEQHQQKVNKYLDRHQGSINAGKTLFLGRGMKYVWNPNTMKEMQFPQGREWNREEVAGIFGVPVEELKGTADVNMITAAGKLSSNKSFWTNKLVPTMVKIESGFNHQWFRRIDPNTWLEFDYDSIGALQSDLNTRLEAGIKMRDLGWTQREINDKLKFGMPANDASDIIWVPPGMMPLEDLSFDDDFDFGEEPPPPPPEAPPEDEPQDDEPDGGNPPPPPPPSEEPEEEMGKRGKVVVSTRPDLDEHWQRIARHTIIPFEFKFRSRFRSYLMKLRSEQLQLLDNLNIDGSGKRTIVDQVLFDKDKWRGIIEKAHMPIYFQAANVALRKVDEELDEVVERQKALGMTRAQQINVTAPTKRPEKAKDIARQRLRVLVKANDTTQKKVARAIDIGMQKGETQEKIANRVRKVFNNISKKWAKVVARTEIASVVNEARQRNMLDRKVV